MSPIMRAKIMQLRQSISNSIDRIYMESLPMKNTCLILKEIYCSDCKLVLARYSTKYFTDLNINMLVHSHFSYHIKNGHSMETRLVEASES
jgi:hypothetical protein